MLLECPRDQGVSNDLSQLPHDYSVMSPAGAATMPGVLNCPAEWQEVFMSNIVPRPSLLSNSLSENTPGHVGVLQPYSGDDFE